MMGEQSLNTKTTTEDVKLEDMFQELDRILEQMESADVPLEDAFSLYEKGMKMIRQCNERLDLVEKKMLMIAQDGTEISFEA